jgi:lipoprotein-anchoring transpeptidase ErfK/SrfK
VVILVSLPDQLLYVYRNGVRIGRSTVSTGKPGKGTPTGVFTVLQKKVRHESSIYKGAQMPHMRRLTWTGIAIHAGHLPGYPVSAGCVRLPVDFAAKLYAHSHQLAGRHQHQKRTRILEKQNLLRMSQVFVLLSAH